MADWSGISTVQRRSRRQPIHTSFCQRQRWKASSPAHTCIQASGPTGGSTVALAFESSSAKGFRTGILRSSRIDPPRRQHHDGTTSSRLSRSAADFPRYHPSSCRSSWRGTSCEASDGPPQQQADCMVCVSRDRVVRLGASESASGGAAQPSLSVTGRHAAARTVRGGRECTGCLDRSDDRVCGRTVRPSRG